VELAAVEWNIPVDYSALISRTGSALVLRRFATLAEYSQATHQDRHSVALNYDIFVNVPSLNAQDLAKVQKLYKAEDFDFRLKPDSAAIDRGVNLPNVTDGFTGRALELGQTPPHSGPRP
jgi:hypothetical protein